MTSVIDKLLYEVAHDYKVSINPPTVLHIAPYLCLRLLFVYQITVLE